MGEIKVAIHQPEHFPYMGFFQKMEYSDVFIILDDVQYSKPSIIKPFSTSSPEQVIITVTPSDADATIPIISLESYAVGVEELTLKIE